MTASDPPANPKTGGSPLRRKERILPYVADSILLEETGMPWLVRSSIIAAIAIVLLFIGWSAVARSAEVSVAPGWIKPSGALR